MTDKQTTAIDCLKMGYLLVIGAVIATIVAWIIWHPFFAYAAGFWMGMSLVILGVEMIDSGWKSRHGR